MTEKQEKAILELFKDKEAAELIWYAVCMRKNMLDTGSQHISAEDVRDHPNIFSDRVKYFSTRSKDELSLSNKLEIIKSVLWESF